MEGYRAICEIIMNIQDWYCRVTNGLFLKEK
jgi:hypothetical protein